MMLKSSKWTALVPADRGVAALAREALAARLQAVWHLLSLVVYQPQRDEETVHQLRVWTRRSLAAMEIFSPLLPAGRTHWLAKQLKKIRKAAGAARDLDVLAGRFGHELADSPAETAFLARLAECQKSARQPMESIYHQLREKGFPQRVTDFLDRVRWRLPGPEPSFAQSAAAAMRRVVEPFLAQAARPATDIHDLHQFRILGKQVRYAMEAFAGAYDAAWRNELYPKVEEIQERLGTVNDHAVAVRWLSEWAATWDEPELAKLLLKLIKTEELALRRGQARFTRWFSPSRVAELERRFSRYFNGSPATKGRKETVKPTRRKSRATPTRAAATTPPANGHAVEELGGLRGRARQSAGRVVRSGRLAGPQGRGDAKGDGNAGQETT